MKKKSILIIGLIILIVLGGIIFLVKKINTVTKELLTEEELIREIGARTNSDKISAKVIKLTENEKEVLVFSTKNKIENGSINLNDKINKSIEDDKLEYLVGYGYQSSRDIYLYLLSEKKDVYYINYKEYDDINSDNLNDSDKLDITDVDRLILVDMEITYEEGNEVYSKGDKVTAFKVYAEKNKELYDLSSYSNAPRGY